MINKATKRQAKSKKLLAFMRSISGSFSAHSPLRTINATPSSAVRSAGIVTVTVFQSSPAILTVPFFFKIYDDEDTVVAELDCSQEDRYVDKKNATIRFTEPVELTK